MFPHVSIINAILLKYLQTFILKVIEDFFDSMIFFLRNLNQSEALILFIEMLKSVQITTLYVF